PRARQVVAISKQPFIVQLDIAISRILADPDVQLASLEAAVLDLLDVARDLRDLPRPDFKARLRADLERNISMSTKTVVYRPGFRTLTPYLLPPNEGYLDFLKNVFGAVQTQRTETSPTSFHAEMQIGDSMIMLGVGSGRKMPIMLQIFVPNADEVYERAIAAGSKSLLGMNEGYGERYGVIEDPGGNQWIIGTHLNDDAFAKPPQTIMTWFHPQRAAKFIDFVKRAFGAREVARADGPEGRVNYAQLQIGDSVIALN